MKKILLLLFWVYGGFCPIIAQEQDSINQPLILLNSKMLEDANIDVKFINSFDFTPEGQILLSSSNQFYSLGWQEFTPLEPKMQVPVYSFAYTQAEVLLLTSGNSLCLIDSLGRLAELFKLPNDNMGIVAGDSVLYVYDMVKQEKGYALYQLQDNLTYQKLVELPYTITFVIETNGIILFSSKSSIFSIAVENKKIEKLIQLPNDNEEITSITMDNSNNVLYFASKNNIYGMKDRKVWSAVSELGGLVKCYYDELCVFNPEKRLLILFPIGVSNNEMSLKEDTTLVEHAELQPDMTQVASTTDSITSKQPETPPAKTQPQQPKATEQPSDVTEAIDYVTEVKELVDLFRIKQRDFTNTVLKWNQQIEAVINEIDQTNAIIAQTEKELDDTKNSAATGVTQKVNALKSTLTRQRALLKQMKQKQVNKGMEIIEQLKDVAKQDAGDINRKFGEAGKKITPFTTFPALSEKRTKITFSEEIEKLTTSDYLKATNELRIWYYNAEKSFLDIINERNQRAQRFIDEDGKLSVQWQALRERLSEYQQEPKLRKKEIKDLKKEIATVEKERKNVAKQMKKEADNFAAYLKGYNKDIQTEYKTRIQTVTEEIDYAFRQNL
ncbi:MAG: hypothetical protein LBI60_02290 [Bacteroidales bacterium]|jgi:hypothetical protein|nr:hypothetical protein [Bacteroidales bacterium]